MEKFYGKIKFNNSELEIQGSGHLNNSISDIKLSLNKENLLNVDIKAEAISQSFDFLNEYNFLKSGTSKLEMNIIKDLNKSDWIAKVKSNLFANEVLLKFLNYNKPSNTRASFSGEFYFNNYELKKN